MLGWTACWQRAGHERRLPESALRQPKQKGTGDALADSEVPSASARVRKRLGLAAIKRKALYGPMLSLRRGTAELPSSQVVRRVPARVQEAALRSQRHVPSSAGRPGALRIF